MKNITLLAAAVAAFAAMPAFAQDSSGGVTMADRATVKMHVVKMQSADMMSSKLVGLNVYTNDNKDVGEIQDLVLKDGKTVSGIVLSVGGFLGMGESYVLVDPSSVVVSKKDGTMKAYVDTTKEALEKEPKFTYSKKS